jgi:hypothetical protein
MKINKILYTITTILAFSGLVKSQSYNVTFSVNMSQYVGSFDTVYISGDWNNWSGDSQKLVRQGSSKIWQGTFSIPYGVHQYLFTLDNWNDREIFPWNAAQLFPNTLSCIVTVGSYSNRAYNVTENAIVPTVCWQSCIACGIPVILPSDSIINLTPNCVGLPPKSKSFEVKSSSNSNGIWMYAPNHFQISKFQNDSFQNTLFLKSGSDSIIYVRLDTNAIGNYSDTIICYAVSDNNIKKNIIINGVINLNPIAGFTINNTSQCVNNNSFLFSDTSFISTGTLFRKWNLGNSSNDTSLLVSINKVYSEANNYIIKLISKSNWGCIDSVSKTIVVNPKPIADFTINNDSQCLNYNSFIFTDTSFNNNSRVWSIGNNITTKEVVHSFNNIGTYSVKLLVSSIHSCLDSIVKNVKVVSSPSVGVIVGQTTGIVNVTPYIYSVAQQLNHVYNWTVTNGIIVAGQGTNTATIQWTNTGIGKVKVEIVNSLGCNDTNSMNVALNNLNSNEIINKSHLTIFPNPAKDELIISTHQKLNGVHITITDMLGRKMLEETITNVSNEHTILVNELKSGAYILSIQKVGESIRIKFVKE